MLTTQATLIGVSLEGSDYTLKFEDTFHNKFHIVIFETNRDELVWKLGDTLKITIERVKPSDNK